MTRKYHKNKPRHIMRTTIEATPTLTVIFNGYYTTLIFGVMHNKSVTLKTEQVIGIFEKLAAPPAGQGEQAEGTHTKGKNDAN